MRRRRPDHGPYHGWQYGADGIRTLIPQLEDLARIRPKARVDAYRAREQYGLMCNEVIEKPERRSRYRLHLPYTILLRLGWGGRAGMVYFFASHPVDVERCTGYLVIGRNYDLEQAPQVLRDLEDTIFEQDRRVVESQRPEQVPRADTSRPHLSNLSPNRRV